MSEVNIISNIEQQNMNGIKSSKKMSASKTNFSSFLGETKTMDDIFDKAAKKYNVPVNLVKAIGKAESNFNAKAVSRSGAQGVMQLMPATAKELGVTDSFDAEQNIMGGTKYISGLLKKYNGNTKLALAAYNAGSGNVAKYGGIPPFKETQNYVVKVTNFMNDNINTNTTVTTKPAGQTMNEGNQESRVSTPQLAPITIIQEPVTIEDAAQNYDEIFSYPDYLKVLDLLLEQENKTEEEMEESNYFASQQINYNVPVMNLLNNIN